jgi:hypothetical protein
MVILARMAGITVVGCAPEDVIDMTAQAGNRGVLAGQFESGQVVVEGGRFPAVG